jgi:flavin reductase (DIM6/NTAB) family NADH-FMN oxidoreductase RutF
MKEIDCFQLSEQIIEQLKKGAFLTVRDKNENLNTMTIGWGSLGYMWFKPVFIAMVRFSRYTYKLMENSDEFTVSFPLKGQLKKELEICGTKSGRDIDKFKECNLALQNSQKIKTPVIADCDLNLECKIFYKQTLDPMFISEELEKVYGPGKDYHTLYYGEILSCNVKEDFNL